MTYLILKGYTMSEQKHHIRISMFGEGTKDAAKFGDVTNIVVLLKEAKTDRNLIDKALAEFNSRQRRYGGN